MMLSLWVLLNLFVTIFAKNIWIDDTGGYHGILIAVNESIGFEECDSYRKRFEILLGSFSEQLWYATNGRLHVGSVDVILPKNIKCPDTQLSVEENWNTADIKISNDWSIAEQWAPEGSKDVGVQQPLGCGQQGDYITLNATTFVQIYVPQDDPHWAMKNSTQGALSNIELLGRSLAMGWAQYRWGLFEEVDQTQSHVDTGSKYVREVKVDCQRINLNDDSSLRKISINSTSRLCDHHTHNSEIRNQQNIACSGKSAWEVMENHKDLTFAKPFTPTTPVVEHITNVDNGLPAEISANFDLLVVKRDTTNFKRIEFDYEYEQDPQDFLPKPKINFLSTPQKTVILSLDLSSASIAQASVEWIRGGILRWLFGIGQEVSVAILASYSNTSFPLSLVPLTPGPSFSHQLEEHLALLPFQHEIDDNVYGGSYCLSCVIEESNKILTAAKVSPESSVLIVAACQPDLADVHEIGVQQNVIPIHTISMCPTTPMDFDRIPGIKSSRALSSAVNGDGSAVETEFGRTLTEISKSELLWPGDSRLIVVQEEKKLLREDDVERVGPYRRVRGEILLDSTSDPRLVVLNTSSPAKVVELFSRGRRIQLHRDTPKRYWVLLEEDEHHLSYSFKFLSTSLDIPLTLTTGVYERSSLEGLHVNLKSSSRNYNPTTDQDFLSVWAEVTSNGQRVLNADVTLSLTYLGPAPATYSLRLLDDGSTEPDMRGNDGIYSRYMTWTPGVGRYILTATASSTSNSVTRQSKDGNVMSMRTGHFTTTSSSLSLLIEDIQRGDIFPPSRVTDLKAVQTDDFLVNLTWTAPGGDLDQGSAYQYELKMYTENDILKIEQFETLGIDVMCVHGFEKGPSPVPALFGTRQQCKASIPFANLKWYFAIRAVDGANNTGKISNIVSIFVNEPESTEASFDPDLDLITLDDPAGTNVSSIYIEKAGSWKIYGIVILVVVMTAMFIIVLCGCICCCRNSNTNEEKEDRPIYKIYVNNAYIQEEDGDIKVIGKNQVLQEKDHTQQWVNSLDGEKINELDITDPLNQSKLAKPIRFGVLTNGSIMREPNTPSNSSSKPTEDTVADDYKYKDLSETISNSTTDEGLSSTTTSTATDSGPVIERETRIQQNNPYVMPLNSEAYMNTYPVGTAYPPLGIPPIPDRMLTPVHIGTNLDLSSDDDGGFRRPNDTSIDFVSRRIGVSQYASCRHPQNGEDSHNTSTSSRGTNNTHGTVRSVKKRRHISFV